MTAPHPGTPRGTSGDDDGRAPSQGRPVAAPGSVPADLWVLIAAALCVALGFGLVAPVLPQFARSFDVSVTAASVVVSAFAFFRLVFAPVGGSLVNKLGERRIYMTGLVIVAVSTLFTGLAQNYWQMLVFRALGGLGSTMFTVSAAALLVRLAPPSSRGKVTSYYASAFLIGNIAGPIMGGLLGTLGMRLPFFIYAAALLAATAVVAVFLREGRRREPGTPELPPLTFSEAVRSPQYVGALFGAFANGWTSFGMRVAIVPLFAAQAFTHGSQIAGVSLACFAVGTALVVLIAGRLADSIGRKPLIVVGFLVTGASVGVLGLVSDEVLFVALSIIGGVGTGLLNPAEQAVVADVIGNERSGGNVMSSFQMAQDAGTILGPIAAGVIVDAIGFSWAFGLSGALCLVVGLGWIGVPVERAPGRAGAAAGSRNGAGTGSGSGAGSGSGPAAGSAETAV